MLFDCLSRLHSQGRVHASCSWCGRRQTATGLEDRQLVTFATPYLRIRFWRNGVYRYTRCSDKHARNMEYLVDLGRVRALGVSNFGIQVWHQPLKVRELSFLDLSGLTASFFIFMLGFVGYYGWLCWSIRSVALKLDKISPGFSGSVTLPQELERLWSIARVKPVYLQNIFKIYKPPVQKNWHLRLKE
jgi:hypothetical protein